MWRSLVLIARPKFRPNLCPFFLKLFIFFCQFLHRCGGGVLCFDPSLEVFDEVGVFVDHIPP